MTPETLTSFDSTDHEILTIMQAEGRLGVTEIGRRINLSQPAVSARIKRLEQAGVRVFPGSWAHPQVVRVVC